MSMIHLFFPYCKVSLMTTPSPHAVWFQRPGATWFAGLPVGNGRSGAMVYGDMNRQTLALNDEEFWSPGARERDLSGAHRLLQETRDLIRSGEVLAAQTASQGMLGSPTRGAAYQPLGTVTLTADMGEPAAYHRSLDLRTGIARFEHRPHAGGAVVREVVASRDPSVFLITQSGGNAPTRLAVSSPFDVEQSREGIFTGQWHEVEPNRDLVADSYRLTDHPGGRQLRFGIGVRVLSGTWSAAADGLDLTSPDWAVAVAVGTDFQDQDHLQVLCDRLARCADADALTEQAAADHRAVFDRASISLSLDDAASAFNRSQPTDARLHAVRAGGVDDDLTLLLADYGRYLMIASTVGGALPPTLQGVWNEDTEPAWCSNWTVNINAQMNLWAADPFQVPEAHETLLRLVEILADAGRRTGRLIYGGGWVVHHNTDIWANTAPTTMVEVGLFPAAALWLVQQLFQHLERYPDQHIGERLDPLLDGVLELLDVWLVEDDAGMLVTSPSSTPENAYLLGDALRPRSRAVDPEFWRHGWLGEGPTLDMWLVRDTVGTASRVLRDRGDQSGADALDAVLERLRPVPLFDGEIPEWTWPHRPLELGHRHLSPLYEIYPGPNDLPSCAFEDAARRTLLRRQAGVESSSNGWGGWSKVWAAAVWARLGDGERALASLESLIRSGIAPESLLHAFPDFDGQPAADAVHQSDANMGLPAAVAEMVLQSTSDELRLLPAVPVRWRDGAVRNLRALGGIDVSFRWLGGRVTEVELMSVHDADITVATPHATRAVHLAAGVVTSIDDFDPESDREKGPSS